MSTTRRELILGADVYKRQALSFQNGKFCVFDGRLVQRTEFGEFREHFVAQLNAVAQFCFSEHIHNCAARLRGHVLKNCAADLVGAVLGLREPTCLQGRGACLLYTSSEEGLKNLIALLHFSKSSVKCASLREINASKMKSVPV